MRSFTEIGTLPFTTRAVAQTEIKTLKELHVMQAAEKTAWSVKCLLGGKNKTQAWWRTFVMHWVNISLKLNGQAA